LEFEMKPVRNALGGIVSDHRICYSGQERNERVYARGLVASAQHLDVAGPFLEREVENVGGVSEELEEAVDAVLLDERIGIFFALQVERGHSQSRGKKNRGGAERGVAAGVIAVVGDDHARCVTPQKRRLPAR